MSYLDFVVLAVPIIFGVIGAQLFGPSRGTLFGGIATVIVILFLLLFQVSPPEPGSAIGLMKFEWYRWLPSFLVGAAAGSLAYRARQPKA